MKDVKIRPLADRIVVKREQEKEVSQGGIIMSGTAIEKPCRGQVIAVGPGKHLDNGEFVEVDVSVGDYVLFGKQSGVEVALNDSTVLIMFESDIMGVLTVK